MAVFEAYLGDRWYLFDPTELSPLDEIVRIGTGRDAADVAFATFFGAARTRRFESLIELAAPGTSLVALQTPGSGHSPRRLISVSVIDGAGLPPL